MEQKFNRFRNWLEFLDRASSFFKEKGYLEVCTPSLVKSGAMEASLDAFQVKGLEGERYFLPTSPEFSLKKLWLGGLAPDIFEISKSFRAGEQGSLHLPEFTMLEFYREGATFEGLIQELHLFFCTLLSREFELKLCSVPHLFKEFTGFDLKPDTSKEELVGLCQWHSIAQGEISEWKDLYHLLFLNLIEPNFCGSELLLLKDFPPQIAALSRISQEGWAERVEVFYRGRELANGYNELLDSAEIKSRWLCENKERDREGRVLHPLDEELLELHQSTLVSQGGGAAIGLERVFSCLYPEASLKVWPFESSNCSL